MPAPSSRGDQQAVANDRGCISFRCSYRGVPFGAPPPLFFRGGMMNASRPFEAELSYRLKDNSGAKCVARTSVLALQRPPRGRSKWGIAIIALTPTLKNDGTGWLTTQSIGNQSPHSNSLISGKNTGKFAKSRVTCRGQRPSYAAKSIPYTSEQGI
jgi:hypothetical protein